MSSPDEIDALRHLLDVHRMRLSVLLEQLARVGNAYAPPHLVLDIQEARKEIGRIKQMLYSWGEAVDVHPGDVAYHPSTPSLTPPVQIQLRGDFTNLDPALMDAAIRSFAAILSIPVEKVVSISVPGDESNPGKGILSKDFETQWLRTPPNEQFFVWLSLTREEQKALFGILPYDERLAILKSLPSSEKEIFSDMVTSPKSLRD